MNNSKKDKLIEFLAMGWDLKLNDEDLSHRFRTVFTNNNNESFFIEFGIHQVHNNCITSQRKYIGEYIIRIDHLFRLKYADTNVDPDYAHFERCFNDIASIKNLLRFLNTELNCSFEKLAIGDNLTIDYTNKREYKIERKK